MASQETLAAQRDYLLEKLPGLEGWAAGRDDGKAKGEMAALFWRKERFEKLAGGHFWLSETPDQVGSKGWDAALPRIATWVKLHDRQRPQAPPVLFLNTHFDHKGAKARLEAAKLLRTRLATLGAGCSLIVTGDFNAGEGSPPYEALFGKQNDGAPPIFDSYRRAHPQRGEAEGTFNGFKPDATQGPRIDWIGCSPDFTVEAAGIDRSARQGRTPSDHFPVFATLRPAGAPAPAGAAAAPTLLSVVRIWNQAPHNAFTDLVRYRGRWWCVLREGKAHVSPDGALRLLTSADGVAWESAALLASPKEDLRDAKLSETPDGRLMLLGAGALHQPAPHTHQTYAWFSRDGKSWSAPIAVGDPNYWLWRLTWRQGVGFGVGYACGKPRGVRLYRTEDGEKFETLVPSLLAEGYPNESAIEFLPDGQALCLLRRDPDPGLLGTAKPPYREWSWKEVGCRIGGPSLLRLPDGRLVAAVRLHDGKVRTALAWLDPQSGRLTEFLALPSGGDTSYAGLVWHDGQLWVSYYSSHEGKAAIYLARVRLPAAG